MPSFESIDRLRHHSSPAPPELFGQADPGTRASAENSTPPRSERSELAPDVETRRQLSQALKMEAISRVAGGIAHNFNNLLTGIMGFCDLMSMDTTDRAPVYRDRILKAASSGSDLIHQLLAFSQQQVLHPEPISVNRTIAELEPGWRRAAAKAVEYVSELESRPWKVRADPKQIERVLSNLVTNAFEAMPEGGRLTVRTRNLEVDGFSVSHLGIQAGRYVLIEVEDTGVGIDDEIYARIFEPFFSTKQELNTTGLGLSTVFGIVKQSDGEIRLTSSPGHGTRCRIYLPRTDRDSPAVREGAPHVESPGRHAILLAEDDARVQLVLKAILARQGHDVLAARDGVEAAEVSEQYEGSIDLLVTDIVMPRMDGIELAQKVLETRAGTKVLFISGFSQKREILHELLGESTEVDFLKKPFETETLALKLQQMLDHGPPRVDGRQAVA